MALRIKQASEGKVFAYKDQNGEEIILGSTLYLGINDDGSRYYEIDEVVENAVEATEYNVVENKEII